MKFLYSLLLIGLLCVRSFAQTGIAVPQMSNCDNLVNNFLTQFNIPGATFAMAKNGKLVYMRGFGEANLAGTENTQPYHMFRIASVSKPITAIAIMKLVQEGKLNLSDKVFGTGGRLASHPYLSTVVYSDVRINDITIQHLLEHTAGWNRDTDCVPFPNPPYTWSITHCDPIGFPLYVTQTLGETNPVREEVLIRFLMEKGLTFTPGTQYAYSNIGYLVLGEIIASVSGKSYEDYLKEDILAPLGIYDMYIGKNLLADKREREAEYYGNGYLAPSIYNTGQNVPWEYGGWNLEAMDAHGGWIATARDLVRLLVAVDGFNTKPDILNTASINTMTTPSTTNANYAKGWTVNSANNWWHTGALDGTASIWVRSSGGYTWAVILNKRIIDNTSNSFWSGLDNLPWNCIGQTTTWPTHDLFDFPSQNSSDFVFASQSTTSLQVSWTNGNGSKRVLVAREEGRVNAFPLDGEDYTANAAFGQGDNLGNGNFIVYNGDGNSVILTGLTEGKKYHFRLFDYNQSTTSGNHALYQLALSAQDSATTATNTSLEDLASLGIRFYPNPMSEKVHISLPSIQICSHIELHNMQGQLVRRVEVSDMEQDIFTGDLPAQIYLLSFFGEDGYLGSERLLKR
ncbi:MAG: serine hydrolase [Bacteroidia bacterium]|nr:serine hydrolase [Bacteroidia bacterium]